MRVATVLVMLTIASPALADGAIVESCDWSAAGSCPFNATKGADYLIDLTLGTDWEATIQLVNPAGQVTKSLSVEQLTDFCDGSTGGVEFRAASTGEGRRSGSERRSRASSWPRTNAASAST